MYCGLMVSERAGFRLEAGPEDGAAFYPAATPMRDREHPGLRFTLPPGGGWQWTGPAGLFDASLTDVLAAACYARVAGLPGHELIGQAAIHAAHEQAARAAVRDGDAALAARLMDEQSEVSAPALVGEEEAARRLGITGRSLNNLRLQYRTICAPVLIAGDRRTKWFWAPAQFAAWQDGRPGRDWRKGHSAVFPRVACPECGRDVAAAGPGEGQVSLRPHKRLDSGDWCERAAGRVPAG